jgi:hypothetical protein
LRDVVMSFVIAGRDTTANVCDTMVPIYYNILLGTLLFSLVLVCVSSPGLKLVSVSSL